jgi:hypothetical protein
MVRGVVYRVLVRLLLRTLVRVAFTTEERGIYFTNCFWTREVPLGGKADDVFKDLV